jgi:hypothetical protein
VLAPKLTDFKVNAPKEIRFALQKLEGETAEEFGPRQRIKVVEGVIHGAEKELFAVPESLGMFSPPLGRVPVDFGPHSDAWRQTVITVCTATLFQSSQTQEPEASVKSLQASSVSQPWVSSQNVYPTQIAAINAASVLPGATAINVAGDALSNIAGAETVHGTPERR